MVKLIKSKVYVLTDKKSRIILCEGGYTTPSNLEGWTQIDEGTGDCYNLCQSHYFEDGLYINNGIPQYKLVDGKATKRTDEEILLDRESIPQPSPQPDLQAMFMLASMQAQSLTDAQALTVPTLYSYWEANVAYGGDNQVKIVRRLIDDNDQLYRCNKPHTSQLGWEPENVPALWIAINKSNAGTLDDPIPAVKGMEYTYGLYYIDPNDKKVYLCKRTGEQDGNKVTLQYLPHELIGIYFEEV